ncbi:hypothetical protein M514_12262 [Trichuris suis]|uniref:Retrotransposon gag domain-containing protein n=1 Tax=Trichuris suis TaxID=68888 RepID=A0A085MTI0_9BILA|nr:hypothetical protein M513_12262 [Trichuris suis]KFD60526.1 hypothetical protein M514_12262 [Trichuris suis]
MSDLESKITYCINSVSLPRPFENGNFTEWLLKFDLSANANGWDDAVKRLKLPTLLEREAFLVYRSVCPDNCKSYRELVEALKSALRPISTMRIAYSRTPPIRQLGTGDRANTRGFQIGGVLLYGASECRFTPCEFRSLLFTGPCGRG